MKFTGKTGFDDHGLFTSRRNKNPRGIAHIMSCGSAVLWWCRFKITHGAKGIDHGVSKL
jgi:hypothetical protein